jgi:phosphoglycolate phosphatase
MNKLIIFDWDGTIVDSTSHIVQSINKACYTLYNQTFEEKKIKSVIGLSLPVAFKNLTGLESQTEFNEFADLYKKLYIIERPRPFDGVVLGLDRLKKNNFTLAVATGKSRRGLDNDFTAYDLGKYFSDSKTADECFSKPHPQMIEEICANLMFDRTSVTMVGDSLMDQNMAKNAHVNFVGINYGASSLGDFDDYGNFFADSPILLFDWLLNNA